MCASVSVEERRTRAYPFEVRAVSEPRRRPLVSFIIEDRASRMEEHGGADITDSEEERGGGGESSLGSRMVEDGYQFIQVYILYLE